MIVHYDQEEFNAAVAYVRLHHPNSLIVQEVEQRLHAMIHRAQNESIDRVSSIGVTVCFSWEDGDAYADITVDPLLGKRAYEPKEATRTTWDHLQEACQEDL